MLVEQLALDLIKLGYPEASIRQEFPIKANGNLYRIDIAVIDPESNDVLAIFEVKANPNITFHDAKHQIDRYSKLFPSNPRAFLCIQSEGKIQLAKIHEESGLVTPIEKLPSFQSLLTGDRAHNKIRTENKTNTVTDNFTNNCRFLAFFVLIILLLDISGIYKFSTQQLTLLGIFIGLLVIPYAAKFKLLGMEFERYSGKSGKNT